MKIHTYGDMKPSRLLDSVRPFLRKPIFQSFYTIKLTIFALKKAIFTHFLSFDTIFGSGIPSCYPLLVQVRHARSSAEVCVFDAHNALWWLPQSIPQFNCLTSMGVYYYLVESKNIHNRLLLSWKNNFFYCSPPKKSHQKLKAILHSTSVKNRNI